MLEGYDISAIRVRGSAEHSFLEEVGDTPFEAIDQDDNADAKIVRIRRRTTACGADGFIVEYKTGITFYPMHSVVAVVLTPKRKEA